MSEELIGVRVRVRYYVTREVEGEVTAMVPPSALLSADALREAVDADGEWVWSRQPLTESAVDTDDLAVEFVRTATPVEVWDMPGVDEYDYGQPTLRTTLEIKWVEDARHRRYELAGTASLDVPFALVHDKDRRREWLDDNMSDWISNALDSLDGGFPVEFDEQYVTGSRVLGVAGCVGSLDQDQAEQFAWEETAEAKTGRPNLLASIWHRRNIGMSPEQWLRPAIFPREV